MYRHGQQRSKSIRKCRESGAKKSGAKRCFQAFDGAPVNRSTSDWASRPEHFLANWALICREMPQFNGSDFDDSRPSVFQNGIGNFGPKKK
jgi:hypothetical protein